MILYSGIKESIDVNEVTEETTVWVCTSFFCNFFLIFMSENNEGDQELCKLDGIFWFLASCTDIIAKPDFHLIKP